MASPRMTAQKTMNRSMKSTITNSMISLLSPFFNQRCRSVSQLIQSIQRRDLVGLGERRVVEHRVPEVLDRRARVHNRLSDVNELRRPLADDVDAEQLQIPRIKQQLQPSGLVAENLPSRQFLISGDPDLVRNLFFRQLPLGFPDHGNFRNGVDAIRQGGRGVGRMRAEHMTGRQTTLFHRGRRQRRKADDIPRGIDVWNRGLEMLVDADPAALVERDAGGFQVQQIGVRLSTHGVEQRRAGDGLSALQRGDHVPARILFHREYFFPEAEDDPEVPQVILQMLDDLAVHEVEYFRPLLDDRHPNLQRRAHRGVLDSDYARADHDQVFRYLREALQLARVNDYLAVEGNHWIARRPSAAGDENLFGA